MNKEFPSSCDNGDLASFLLLSVVDCPLPFKVASPSAGQFKLPNYFAFFKNMEHYYQKGLQKSRLASLVDKEKKHRVISNLLSYHYG